MFKKFFCVLACFLLVSAVFAQDTVWKVTSLNWEPYSGDSLINNGSSIQALRDVLAQRGIRLVVEFYPWKRAQALAADPGYVGYFPAWPEEVTGDFSASTAVDWSEIALMKKKEYSISFTTMSELFSTYKVGIIGTYVYPESIDSAMKAHPRSVDESPDEMTLMRKLNAGRIDVAITDPNVMLYYAGQDGITSIEVLEVVMKKELVIAMNSTNPNNAANKALLEELTQ